ncbi:MAG: SH3 domain-containing protein [Christensenella sp.]|nr:SH3 domain-containing protein [Christensenella sp.]
MTKIAHAFSDENKQAKGGQAGDQTGREIFVQNWYERDGGWEVYLEPTDRDMAEAAAATAIDIAEDDSFGYDQSQRWTGAEAIADAGDIFSAEASEFDCSSFVDTVYGINGLEIERGYTGNLEQRYVDTGLFIAHREPKYLKSGKYATVGGLYLTAGKHVAIVVEADENPAETEADEDEPITEEETFTPYVLVLGSVNVRKTAGTDGKLFYIAHRGDRLPYLGADASGWYEVETPKGNGFISNKPKYTKLVTE